VAVQPTTSPRRVAVAHELCSIDQHTTLSDKATGVLLPHPRLDLHFPVFDARSGDMGEGYRRVIA